MTTGDRASPPTKVNLLVLVLVATTLATLPQLSQSEITVCDEVGNATCAQNLQVCLFDTSTSSSTCGNCLKGYIDFEFDEPLKCRKVDELPWEEYFERFEPKYAELAATAAGGEEAEEATRRERVKRLYDNLDYISWWRAQIPPPTFRLGVNRFSGDTEADRKQLLGFRPLEGDDVGLDSPFPRWDETENVVRRHRQRQRRLQGGGNLPPKVDFVETGGVTEVKDQGRCGCCWALSNVGSIEGATYINAGYLEDLSFQQLISCDNFVDNFNDGCNGGNIVYALDYSVKNSFGGLTTLADYPYSDFGGTTTAQCQLDGKPLKVMVDNPRLVMTYSDELTFEERREIMKAAVARQPVSMALMSNCDLFLSYSSGIMTLDDDCACESVDCIDHAVLLVGYDDTTDPPSWKLKNTWSTRWGEDGYFRISQEGGGRWGLFGMLGEGVLPLVAVNTTSANTAASNSAAAIGDSPRWWTLVTGFVAGAVVAFSASVF